MPYQIGQCCEDQIIVPDPSSSDLSGKNETVQFINLATMVLAWNATRISRFGTKAVFYVEMKGEDGVYRPTPVQAVPDNVDNPTTYTFDFGGVNSGRIVIT
jgi:hypothetical protein